MADRPTWLETIRAVIGSELDATYHVIPGAVADWSRATGLADIRPLVDHPDGHTLPVVPSVPVLFPVAYQDIENGTAGLLLVSDLDYRRWRRTEEVGVPETTGRSTLANAAFLPGLVSSVSPRSIPDNATVLLKPSAGGSVRLGEALAYQPVICGDKLKSALSAWSLAVRDAVLAAGGSDLTAARTTLRNAIESAKSPSVYVED